jgi:hypothetical protein
MGRPLAGGGKRKLRYRGGLTLGLRDGRVQTITVSGPAWTSTRGSLRVGARSSAIRRALPTARRSGRTWRATLALDGGGRATVQVDTDRRRARVTRIVVRAAGRSS